MKAYLKTKSIRKDGSFDSFLTISVPVVSKPLWWQEKGLSYTASGYGPRIPTRYMVKVNNKWQRVYCCIYSNIATCFIGKKYDGTNVIDISI
jgi:hypothetical protein